MSAQLNFSLNTSFYFLFIDSFFIFFNLIFLFVTPEAMSMPNSIRLSTMNLYVWIRLLYFNFFFFFLSRIFFWAQKPMNWWSSWHNFYFFTYTRAYTNIICTHTHTRIHVRRRKESWCTKYLFFIFRKNLTSLGNINLTMCKYNLQVLIISVNLLECLIVN